MKTKKKTFVALLATFAIGTASVAGLAFSANANHGVLAHADTSFTEVNDSDIALGINTVTLNAGEEETFDFDITQVGTYGFKWVSGAAVFKFEDISLPSDPDDPIYDPSDPLTGVSDPYENVPLGLNEDIDYFYVKIATPNTAKVTITAEESTEIKFEVTHRIDTGLNVFNSGSYKVNDILAGEYKLDLVAGSGTVSIGDVNYVLDTENTTYDIELSSPATTQVVISSNGGAALQFNLTFNETVEEIVVGTNTLSGDSYVVIDSISAGYYTFAHTDGAAAFTIGNKTFVLDDDIPEFTVYIGSPKNTVIAITNVTALSFNLSYSETLNSSTLKLGPNDVKADGMGLEYTLTNSLPFPVAYTLSCNDENAFIMVRVAHEVEGYGTVWSDEWIEGETYTFTLNGFETITFIMATNDWEDDTYRVTITQA